MTPTDLATRIVDTYSPRLFLDETTAIVEALASLGYTFEEPGVPGRYHHNNEEWQGMRLYLSRKTGLHIQIVRHTLTAIERLHLMIREPDQHPSGLHTTARAYEDVPRSGAQAAALRKPIDTRMPGMGRNYA